MGWGAFVVCRAIVGCNCGTQGSAAPSSPPTTHLLPRPTALPPHPTWLAPSFPSAPTCHFLTPRQLLPPPHPPPPLPPLSSSIPASLSCANPPPHLSHRRPSSASSHPPCKSLPTPSLHADSAGAPQQPHLLPRWRPQRHAAGHAGRGESRRGQVRVRGGGGYVGSFGCCPLGPHCQANLPGSPSMPLPQAAPCSPASLPPCTPSFLHLLPRFWLGTNITCLKTSTSGSGTTTYTAYAAGNSTSWTAETFLGASTPGQMQYIEGGLAKKLNK